VADLKPGDVARLAIGASGVVVVAAVVLSAAPSAVYHLGCALGIILLIAGMSVVLVGRWREIQSDEDAGR